MMWRLIKRTSYLAEELHPKDNLKSLLGIEQLECVYVFLYYAKTSNISL